MICSFLKHMVYPHCPCTTVYYVIYSFLPKVASLFPANTQLSGSQHSAASCSRRLTRHLQAGFTGRKGCLFSNDGNQHCSAERWGIILQNKQFNCSSWVLFYIFYPMLDIRFFNYLALFSGINEKLWFFCVCQMSNSKVLNKAATVYKNVPSCALSNCGHIHILICQIMRLEL